MDRNADLVSLIECVVCQTVSRDKVSTPIATQCDNLPLQVSLCDYEINAYLCRPHFLYSSNAQWANLEH